MPVMYKNVLNLTDAPNKTPTNIDVYTATIAPGEMVQVPVRLIDTRLMKLEKGGMLAIGTIPKWYQLLKLNHKEGQSLQNSRELLTQTKASRAARAAKKAARLAAPQPPAKVAAPVPTISPPPSERGGKKKEK